MKLFTAEELARMHGYHVDHSIQAREAMCRHRVEMAKYWQIEQGDSIIDVGCGHGEGTLALSNLVGEAGHVTGIDMCPPTYGAPLTVGAAQTALKKSPLAHRFDFHLNSTVESFLAQRRQSPRNARNYNKVVFCHSLWYFKSRDELSEVFDLLWHKMPDNTKICLGEWGLTSSSLEGTPHVHSALTQQALEYHKSTSLNNLRTLLAPASLKELAYERGWDVEIEGFFETAPDVIEGRLEVGIVLSQRWWTEVEKRCKEKEAEFPGLIHSIRQYWEALDMATDTIGIDNVRSMDTFYAVLVKRKEQGGTLQSTYHLKGTSHNKVSAYVLGNHAPGNAPSRRKTTKRKSKPSSKTSTPSKQRRVDSQSSAPISTEEDSDCVMVQIPQDHQLPSASTTPKQSTSKQSSFATSSLASSKRQSARATSSPGKSMNGTPSKSPRRSGRKLSETIKKLELFSDGDSDH